MKLPSMAYADKIKKQKQDKFGGLNHTLGAGDGELWEMKNLTGDHYPLLASRAPRLKYRTLTDPRGIYCREKLCWVDGTDFYYDGTKVEGLTLRDTPEKAFAALGTYIIIAPDMVWYDTVEGKHGSLAAEWTGTSLTFTNGLYKGEAAEANTLQATGVDWSQYFRPGDAVTIEGCTKHPDNNKMPVIREIDGDKLYFYENVFELDGDEGATAYTESGLMSVKRAVPELRFLCENENRLWGCDDNTIYACKLGDPFNWDVNEGLATDSYTVDTGSAGSFTGCISYLGYPIFFKEDHIYKVYGSIPSNYEVMGSATLGVAAGSHRSLAVAGEILFYLSRAGIMAYSGGIPQPVGAAFGTVRYKDARAGSDGLKYYVSMTDDKQHRLFVYDVQRRQWHVEDESCAVGFVRKDGCLYMVNSAGEIWIIGSAQDAPKEVTAEGSVEWMAEFGDFTEEDPNKKGVSKIQIRLELDAGATAQVEMRLDSDGDWLQVGGRLQADVKRSVYLPIIPRRADHYRLRLSGTGGCRVYSIVRETYGGSEYKSRRN